MPLEVKQFCQMLRVNEKCLFAWKVLNRILQKYRVGKAADR